MEERTTTSTENELIELKVKPKSDDTIESNNTIIEETDNKEEVSTEEVKQEDESMELKIRRVLKNFDKELTDKDIDILLELMERTNKSESVFLFNKLPQIIQKRLNATIKHSNFRGSQTVQKEKLAGDYLSFLANNIMRLVWADAMKEQPKKELDEDRLPPIEDEKLLEEWKAKRALYKIHKDIDDLLKNTYKEAFDNVEEIEKEDPARADRVRAVQKGFKYAENFQPLIDYLDNDSPKNIKRYHQHYNSDTETMHKYVGSNCFKIAAPSTSMMYNFLRNHLDPNKYNTNDIKAFITLVCRSIMEEDVNDLEEFSYVFKLLSNIYTINMTPQQQEFTFEEISKVIDYMKSKISGGKK